MDGADLAVLVETGELFFLLKSSSVAIHYMWFYDYFLTLGDEIKYAWSGRKSWIFVFFLANRYTPVSYIIWYSIFVLGYTPSVSPYPRCDKTKWVSTLYTVIITVLAQITFALRIYCVTGKSKLIGGALSALIAAQLCFGMYLAIRFQMGPLQPLPQINLDMFRLCVYKRWRTGELVFTNLAMAFDLITFLAALFIARRRGTHRYPGIPHILDAMLRDATLYFLLSTVFQALLVFFGLFAPLEVQLIPGVIYTVLVPIMASRLMLSLKEAAVEPAVPWSLSTMSQFGYGTTQEHGTIRFSPRALDRSHGISGTPALSDTGDIELESTPRLPWDRGSQS